MTAFVIYNPHAADGRTGRHWHQVQGALESIFPLMEVTATTIPGEAARMVRDALRNGHLDIVAVGGDGLINEALNGFFDRGVPVSPDAVFSFVCTGGRVGRRFGIEPDAGIVRLKQSRIRKLDVGRVACLSPNGEPTSRYFLGGAGFGLPGSVARRLGRARIAPWFGGGFARRWHGLMALLAWRGCRVRLMAPTENSGGNDEIAGISGVTVALKDAGFDIGVAGGGPRLQLWRGLAPMHGFRAKRLVAAPTMETPGPVAVETDGEFAGVLPATFEILRGAVNVRMR